MSTRSVIAIPDNEGWKGRYVHWDGYPTGVGAQVLAIVIRDGVQMAREVLTAEEAYHALSRDLRETYGLEEIG